MAELWFEEEADAALARLDRDTSRARLAQAVNRVLDQLEADPGDRSVRRVRFQIGLWCVTVSADGEEWAVLWDLHPELEDDLVVRYLGPATFR